MFVERLYTFGADVDIGESEEFRDRSLLFLRSREVYDWVALSGALGFGRLFGFYADHIEEFLGFGLCGGTECAIEVAESVNGSQRGVGDADAGQLGESFCKLCELLVRRFQVITNEDLQQT